MSIFIKLRNKNEVKVYNILRLEVDRDYLFMVINTDKGLTFTYCLDDVVNFKVI